LRDRSASAGEAMRQASERAASVARTLTIDHTVH
jgi:hypothetical protein